MRVSKNELSKAIDRCKSVVQKNEAFPALQGILVKDGYLTASNTELTIQVKLEGAEGESLIIPMKAFDIIKALPDGDVDVTSNAKNEITIRMDKIKNSYSSFKPEDFTFYSGEIGEGTGFTLPGMRIMEAFSHVIFAAAKSGSNKTMTGVYICGKGDTLDVVALDGHVIALDSIAAPGIGNIEMIIPGEAVRKMLSLGMADDIEVMSTKNSAVFAAKEYTIFTRLIDGKYFAYNKMFGEANNYTVANRKALVDAMTRTKMCVDLNTPAVLDISGNEMNISAKYSASDYFETVQLETEIKEPIKIGFSSSLLLSGLKAFTCDNISLNFISPKLPVIIQAEDSDMKVLVLPVMLR